MRRFVGLAALIGLGLVTAQVAAITVTPGADLTNTYYGECQVDSDYKIRYSEERAMCVAFPGNGTCVDVQGGDQVSVTPADICGATPTAGNPLCLDGSGKVPSSTLPTGVVTGSGTDNYYPLWATGGTTLTLGTLEESSSILRRRLVGQNTLALYSYSSSTPVSPVLSFVKSHSDVLGTNVTTLDGETLAALFAYGTTTGATTGLSALMKFLQEGAAGATSVPGRWRLQLVSASGVLQDTIDCHANNSCAFGGNISAANIVEAAAASATPKAGIDAKISIDWLPTGTATNKLVTGADPRLQGPAAIACPSGSTCAGKTDSSTSTSTGTGTGTFYATETIPVSQTVTATWTAAAASSTVTSTIAVQKIAVASGIVTATATATASDVGAVAGSGTATGTTNYLTKKIATGWGDSRIYDDGTNITIGSAGTGDVQIIGSGSAATFKGNAGTRLTLWDQSASYPLDLLNISNGSFRGFAQVLNRTDQVGFGVLYLNVVGTGDVFYQIFPKQTTGYGVLESYDGAGLVLSSIVHANSYGYIYLNPNRGGNVADFRATVGANKGGLYIYSGNVLALKGTSGTVIHSVDPSTASYTLTDPTTAPGAGQTIVYPSGGGQGTWATPLAGNGVTGTGRTLVTSWTNGQIGAVANMASSDVTTALGYTPVAGTGVSGTYNTVTVSNGVVSSGSNASYISGAGSLSSGYFPSANGSGSLTNSGIPTSVIDSSGNTTGHAASDVRLSDFITYGSTGPASLQTVTGTTPVQVHSVAVNSVPSGTHYITANATAYISMTGGACLVQLALDGSPIGAIARLDYTYGTLPMTGRASISAGNHTVGVYLVNTSSSYTCYLDVNYSTITAMLSPG